MTLSLVPDCPHCHGTGRVTCPHCGGAGCERCGDPTWGLKGLGWLPCRCAWVIH